ncbi:putative serine dehydratase domain-containing protein [Mycena floridula]|nr:putative serine dehydratase domain-containing protein [Mycena floridula]
MSKTPSNVSNLPSKAALVEQFVGQDLNNLRTPAFILDRNVFAQNCAKMHLKAKAWGASFRAHLKTHKTIEGTRLQMKSTADTTSAVVVSTLMEAWQVVNGGLFKDGTVKDILYGLPVAPNKIADLASLWNAIEGDGGIVRLLVDHPDQVTFLEKFESQREKPRKWSVFVKVDGGQKRAGVYPNSPAFDNLVTSLFKSPAIAVYGFYGHAGNAYASKSLSEASSFLSGEVNAVNDAAGRAFEILSGPLQMAPPDEPFVLSVGSTPTAHAASAETRAKISQVLHGVLELHAGNYPMLDLQQKETGMISMEHIAQRVRATVVSLYPGRGDDGSDEALIDAGAIAFSKDTGPAPGYGKVIGKNWHVGRMSQEHGTLTRTAGSKDELKIGELVDVVGQHACLIAAAYPWYYIVDSQVENGTKIVDVWVSWKGW